MDPTGVKHSSTGQLSALEKGGGEKAFQSEIAGGGGGGAPLPAGVSKASKSQSQVAKAFAVRKWLAVDPRGEVRHMELAKLRVTAGLGVQLRDLRLLDPHLATSYPSAILARERAIVVNLEFIKCIVAQDNVYITNLDDQNTLQFVEELQRRLHATAVAASEAATNGMFASQSEMSLGGAGTGSVGMGGGGGGGGGGIPLSSIPAAHEELPFELRALEIALDTVSHYLERLTGDLEAAAHPALDALTGAINTGNLERVRRIKSRMVRLTTRVETLREVLEKFLDDDSDMKDLNLTAKEEERLELFNRHTRSGAATPFDAPLPYTGISGAEDGGGLIDGLTPKTPKTVSSDSSASSHSTALEDDPDVAVVEMLMEPYFMQIDNTYNKLQTLCEYIDDTEDYINIELDSKRNSLIRIDLLLMSFSTSIAMITAITGLFAMNVQLRPDPMQNPAPYTWFLTIAVTTAFLALFFFSTIVAYCRWRRLI